MDKTTPMDHGTSLTGTLWALLLFDVAEQIDLQVLQGLLGERASKRQPAFRQRAPEYVRFERPPVEDHIGFCQTRNGETFRARIRYFDYGVASVQLEMDFATPWAGLIQLANRWVLSPELESVAHSLLQDRLKQISGALKKPYTAFVSEDYYIIQLDPIVRDGSESPITGEELVKEYGARIAQVVRGEDLPLATSERQEVLQSSMSYYPTDLLVLGWVAAFLYDSHSAALPTIDLLEYANTQLLEFRYYDELLTDVLERVYKQLERRRHFWSRWRLAQEAENLNTIRLDCTELAERTENAIKFVSDMFYARVYRLAALRIGVNDYRALVTEKLSTAGELYESMVNEFHQGRAFFLELMVVIILIIEIVFLFRGKG